jgi:alkyl hydroperoxide reductase subunit D
VAKDTYSQLRAGLRMNYLLKPASSKATFELMCLAVSAINGCESCVRSHEEAVLKAGLSEAQVNDAVRIAATMMSVAVALELPTS